VLFFASDISPQSGASHALLLTAKRLQARGVEASVMVPDTAASRAFFANFDGQVFFLRINRPRRSIHPVTLLKSAWSWFRTTVALRRILRNGGSHLLHLNEITDMFYGLAASLAGVPCVCHVRSDGIPNPYRAVLVGLLRLFADRVIVPSVSTRNWIVNRSAPLNPRTTIIYDCAFDVDRYDANVSGAAFRQELGIEESAPLVLLVSKLQIAKGHLCFIQAAKEVASELPQVRFAMVGGVVDGHEGEAAAIRKAAEPGVENGYLRMVDVLPDLTGAFAAADIVVHCPVYPDPYPTVMLLGMAMQKALVASDIGGIPEQVKDKSSGLLFPAGDATALAGLLMDLIRDPEKRLSLGLEARRRVRAICDPARQAEQIVEQYLSVLGIPDIPRQSRTAARGSW
jgi:glycosyltransferase involved in cell wall biosynthesis